MSHRASLSWIAGTIFASTWLVGQGSKHGGSCQLGACVSQDVGRRVARDDQGLNVGMRLVQHALWSKRRTDRSEILAHDARQGPAMSVANKSGTDKGGRLHFYMEHPSCARGLYEEEGSVPLPLPVSAQSDLLILSELGVIGTAVECKYGSAPSFAQFTVRGTVEDHNQTAFMIILIWGILAGFVIVWSVVDIARVPKKPEKGEVQGTKLRLADEEGAWRFSPFYWASLAWVDPLMGRYGKCLHSVIDDAEIVEDRRDDHFEPYVKLRKLWNEEVKRKGVAKASLLGPLFELVGWRPLVTMFAAVTVDLFMNLVGMVIALDLFLGHLEQMQSERRLHPEEPQDYLKPTLLAVLCLFGVPMSHRTAAVVSNLLDGYYLNRCAAGLAAVLFEKAMSIPVGSTPPEDHDFAADYYEANKQPSFVQILNVDIFEAWDSAFRTMMACLVSPAVILVLFVMLIQRTHLAGLGGTMYIIPCLIVVFFVARLASSIWKRYQGYQDERLRWLNEAITNIRTIKALAWEKLSFDRLHTCRIRELEISQRFAMVMALAGGIVNTVPWGMLLTTVFFILVTDGHISAHAIIVIHRIISCLLQAIAIMLGGFGKWITVPNSFERIRRFLSQPDPPTSFVRQPALQITGAPVAQLRGSFSFVVNQTPVLHDLDLALPRGQLVAVVGGVASGKSAFLQAVLGELFPAEGASIEGPKPGTGRVVYCSQTPWIFEGTLRENVVLNQALVPERYYGALYAAALTQDLEVLPGGDQVTIGSHGIRLSGGQRARIALARAAYLESAELVVVDDPFASVDVPTGQHIYRELLLGPMMHGRTRVVAMQPNPALLQRADRVVLLEAGRVVATGTPTEVMELPVFQELLAKGSPGEGTPSPLQGGGREGGSSPSAARQGGEQTARICARKTGEAHSSLREQEVQDHVTCLTIGWWFEAAGFFNLGFYLITIVVGRLIGITELLIIAKWINTKMLFEVDDRYFMAGIAITVVLGSVAMVVVTYASRRISISSSTKLHSQVLRSILRATIDKFFDKQPIGRLLNRLSNDMRRVDDAVTGAMTNLLSFFVSFFMTEFFILKVVPWRIALISVPVFGPVLFFIYVFRGTAIPLVFHSKFAMSTMQDLASTVMTCSCSIRANGMVDQFVMRFNHCMISCIRCNYLVFHVLTSWVMSRVFLCFGTLTCIFAVGGLFAELPMGTLAIVISQQFGQMGEFEGISAGFTSLLNTLNALQRLTQYFNVPQEAAERAPSDCTVRRRLQLQRTELSALELLRAEERCAAPGTGGRGDVAALAVRLRGSGGGTVLLRAAAGGCTLKPAEGCELRDLAPGREALRALKGYHIVAVNGVARDAERMAEELCDPPAAVLLDLWHSDFVQGMRVQIKDLVAGYCNDKSVLHGISINVGPRMKMGIAGKTGCGKSTTMLCLLRILEPRGGQILVGGMDTSGLGLATLRSIIGLVPQDPTIFEGTWRSNIDPFGEFPDARIWETLKSMQLLPYVRALPGTMSSSISREGANLSFGQRQLLSLARMVIRQPPVLLLDECTSALDPGTQELVQATLLNEFPMSSVIAIAHRVETILSFDRITVLENGRVAEAGTTEEVLKIEEGIFATMVKSARPAAAAASA